MFQSVCGLQLWKIVKEKGIPDTFPASWETCMQVKKQQLELDVEHLTGSKLEKEYIKAVYCHPAYLTYMQSTLCKMPDWVNPKLESRLQGEILTTLDPDCRWYNQNRENEDKLKSLLMKMKEEREKLAWNLTFKKLRSWHLVPLLHGK